MRVLDQRHHSVFSEGCFYVAFYLCLGAIVLFSYQLLIWLRHGAWMPHEMWLFLKWGGWEQPPSLLGGIGQPVLDRLWSLIGNCPITVVLALMAVAIALLGAMRDPVRTQPAVWRNAH
jgi:hypothetical protein